MKTNNFANFKYYFLNIASGNWEITAKGYCFSLVFVWVFCGVDFCLFFCLGFGDFWFWVFVCSCLVLFVFKLGTAILWRVLFVMLIKEIRTACKKILKNSFCFIKRLKRKNSNHTPKTFRHTYQNLACFIVDLDAWINRRPFSTVFQIVRKDLWAHIHSKKRKTRPQGNALEMNGYYQLVWQTK